MSRKIPVFAGLCLAVGLAAVPASIAGAKPPTSGGSYGSYSIALNPSSPASLGQVVNFITTVYGAVKAPMDEVDCYQGTTLVWTAIQPTGTSFQMGGSGWSPWNAAGGSANCQAFLEYFTWSGHTETGKVVLASTAFSAAA